MLMHSQILSFPLANKRPDQESLLPPSFSRASTRPLPLPLLHLAGSSDPPAHPTRKVEILSARQPIPVREV